MPLSVRIYFDRHWCFQGNRNSVSRFSISLGVAERWVSVSNPAKRISPGIGRRRKISSASRRHRSRARNRWLMTVPLIYRCHFSRIDGIRWYSLCRATTHSHRESFSRDGHSKNSTTALLYHEKGTREWEREWVSEWVSERERDIERGMEICRYRYEFWWYAKKFVSSYSLTYQCYRLHGS